MEQDQTTLHEDDEQQEVWSWGAGTDGQLATGRLQDEHSPQLIRSLSAYGPLVSLSCGGAHVVALSSGTLFRHSVKHALYVCTCVFSLVMILDCGCRWKSVDVGEGSFWSVGPW